MDRRDIEFNAEGVILRGWLYRGEGVSGQTWATCSVNVCRGHVSTRQRQRRLRHCTCAISPPHGRSRGRASTHSFRDVDLTAPVGHRAASGSAVTSCTIFAPAAERAIRSTARPSSPNRHDASSLPLTTARGSSSRCSKTQRGSRRCGALVYGCRTGPASGCPVKLEEPPNAANTSSTSSSCSPEANPGYPQPRSTPRRPDQVENREHSNDKFGSPSGWQRPVHGHPYDHADPACGKTSPPLQ